MTALGAPQLGAGYGRPPASQTYTARIRQKAQSLPRPRSSVAGRLLRGFSLLLALAALSSLAAIGSLQVLQSSRMAASGYELRQLQQQRTELAVEVRRREAEIAQMTNLETVHAAATGRLGMVRAAATGPIAVGGPPAGPGWARPADTVRIAVGVPAPDVAPMPERYVRPAPEPPAPLEPWWSRMLWDVPGLE